MVQNALDSNLFERVIAHYRTLPENPPVNQAGLGIKLPAENACRITSVAGCLTELDYSQLIPARPHLIFHFATSKDRLEDNRVACERICRSMSPDTKGIFYGSSLSVYGDGPHEFVTEAAEIRPQTKLAQNRAACESILQTNSQSPVVCLRPRMMVGVRDQYFLPKITRMFRKGLAMGNEKQQFSFIEVGDYATVVMQLARLLLKEPDSLAPAYNVGYTSPLSLFELRQIVAPAAMIFFRIPTGLSLGLLRGLPFSAAQRLSTKLKLIGRNQTLDPSQLVNLIGKELLGQPAPDMIRKSIVDKA